MGEPHPPSTGSGQRLTPSSLTGRENRSPTHPGHLAFDSATASVLVGATLVVVGFFLPWFRGDGVFALRTFSGFGLARDLHTLTTSMGTVAGGSLTPLLFYIAPAGAVGVALYVVLAGASSGVARLLALLLGIYTFAVTIGALIIAMTPVINVDRYLGRPSWGLGVTAIGATLLMASALWRSERDEDA